MMADAAETSTPSSPERWKLRPRITWVHFLIIFIVSCLLTVSARRVELDRAVGKSAEGVGEVAGIVDESDIGKGWRGFWNAAFPLVFSEKTPHSRLNESELKNPPLFSYEVKESVQEYDADKMAVVKSRQTFRVQPMGYLVYVVWKMVETMEMAIWGTILAVLLAMPLAYCSASGYAPFRIVYFLARGFCSFVRAVPELIGAMFLVLMFGFGPVPGILALAIHTSGFLGKFFADDIENADKGPQEALLCLGVNKIKVLRFAVLPQVLPQYLAYIQYILERNVRTAAVLGIVGAGGIGMELKGRWDLSDFGHVSTILLVVFLTVFALEHLTQFLRRKLI